MSARSATAHSGMDPGPLGLGRPCRLSLHLFSVEHATCLVWAAVCFNTDGVHNCGLPKSCDNNLNIRSPSLTSPTTRIMSCRGLRYDDGSSKDNSLKFAGSSVAFYNLSNHGELLDLKICIPTCISLRFSFIHSNIKESLEPVCSRGQFQGECITVTHTNCYFSYYVF